VKLDKRCRTAPGIRVAQDKQKKNQAEQSLLREEKRRKRPSRKERPQDVEQRMQGTKSWGSSVGIKGKKKNTKKTERRRIRKKTRKK